MKLLYSCLRSMCLLVLLLPLLASLASAQVVATPTFSPGEGTYSTPQTVTLSTTTSGATIYYCFQTPCAATTEYTGPITVSATTVIMAKAVKSGMTDSGWSVAYFTIGTFAATPTANPPSGTYSTPQSVTLSTTTNGAAIYYTTDGSDVTTSSTLYTGPFTVSQFSMIKAMAVKSGMSNSNVEWFFYSFVPPPAITSISPTSGAVGTQITITGSNFASYTDSGSLQGSGAVWLGTNQATVVSWSDTQIIATIAPGSSSGTAHVLQHGVQSNAIPVSVSAPILNSASPTSGVPGTSVTITGTGFGSLQGSGLVTIGNVAATVQNWSDTQIIAVVGAGAATGKARVLQGGVWSNPLDFTIATPKLASLNPTSALPGALVTLTGTGFGSTQGNGTVQLGSLGAQIISWSDTQIVAAVAQGALTGIARVKRDGFESNILAFKVLGSQGIAVSLNPSVVNLSVGEQRTLQALTDQGQPATGLTWSSSDSAVVSLSASDPPVLTALAAGRVTIAAGNASADITVWAGDLPDGTSIWSRPDLGVPYDAKPAVPGPTSVADMFVLENNDICSNAAHHAATNYSPCTVDALKTDGTTAWTTSAVNQRIFPDFQGGFVVVGRDEADENVIIRTHSATTGQPVWTFNLPDQAGANVDVNSIALHPDGTIFAHVSYTGGVVGEKPKVFGIDSATGTEKFRIALPENGSLQASDILIAGDGYAYMPFYYEYVQDACYCPSRFSPTLKVLRVGTSGDSSQFTIFEDGSQVLWRPLASMVADEDGVWFSWWAQEWNSNEDFQPHLTRITGAGVTDGPGPRLSGQDSGPTVPVLQREDGAIIGLAPVGPRFSSNPIPHIVAFDTSGTVLWDVANEKPQIATADGGVIGESGITYGYGGNATGQIGQITQSWTGNDYRLDSFAQVSLSPLLFASTFAAYQGGSPSRNGTAVPSLANRFRAKVADLAKSYVGNSIRWSFATNGGNTTCNLFVRDVLTEASDATRLNIPPPHRPNLAWYQSNYRHPFLAADWANPSLDGGCWKALPTGPDSALPGDIVATGWPYPGTGNPDGTGHVGVVVVPNPGQLSYKTASAAEVGPYWWTAAQLQGFISGTITLTDYGFRSPGFNPADPTNVQGLKRDSHVRRFACY